MNAWEAIEFTLYKNLTNIAKELMVVGQSAMATKYPHNYFAITGQDENKIRNSSFKIKKNRDVCET
jgi:hypothetical protein